MHSALQLLEDFLSDRGALDLPARPRMIFVVRGSATIGTATLGKGEAWQGEGAVTVLAGPTGATLWFNYRNRRTKRWAEGGLRKRHDYSVRFPDDDVAGSVLELPERP